MESLWKEIGYKSKSFVLDVEAGEEEVTEDIAIKVNEGFTPAFKKTPWANDKLTGVSIRNLPIDIPENEAAYFLETHGLPPGHPGVNVNRAKKRY